MDVREVMSRGVECVKPEATIQEAARRMKELNVGTMPVSADSQSLVGIVTDRDLAIRALAEGKGPQTPVRDAMSPHVVCCSVEDDVEDAASLMKKHQIRRLPVLDQNQRLCGIVTLGDLAVETRGAKIVSDALERISEPVHPLV